MATERELQEIKRADLPPTHRPIRWTWNIHCKLFSLCFPHFVYATFSWLAIYPGIIVLLIHTHQDLRQRFYGYDATYQGLWFIFAASWRLIRFYTRPEITNRLTVLQRPLTSSSAVAPLFCNYDWPASIEALYNGSTFLQSPNNVYIGSHTALYFSGSTFLHWPKRAHDINSTAL